ncbi:MAG: lipopolysaccharide heptosyltransferase II [Vicinamibacteraceae bacterium]
MTRIVVRAPNWLGDIVMTMPAIAAVRAAHPGAHLAVAAPAAFADVCAAIPGVDGVVPLAGSGIRALSAHVDALRAGAFDLAILFTNSFASALAASRAGIAERWGYRRDLRGRLLTRAIAPRPRRRGKAAEPPPGPAGPHHSAYYLRLVAGLGMPPVEASGATADLRAPAAAVERAAALLAEAGVRAETRLVGFAPGAAYGSAKRWPPERVAEAIAGVTGPGVRAVLVGAAADREIVRAILSALDPATRDAVVDLAGRTDVATLMAVLARCAVVVANDSGAMHVASAVGRPVVAIFGPTDERATAPLGRHTLVRHDVFCRPCLLRACPIDHRCLQGVAAATVVAAVSQYRTDAP